MEYIEIEKFGNGENWTLKGPFTLPIMQKSLLFEDSCVATVYENNQLIMLKIHQLIFFIIPIKHKQSHQTSSSRFLPMYTSP